MTGPEYVSLRGGGRLAYSVRGKGPPLLLLRPVGGSMLSWGRFGDALARGARVVAFDPPGTGASRGAAASTTRQMARDALALLEHLELARANLFGLSLGGMVASWAAIDAPERVGRLVLASTLPRGLAIRPGASLRAFELIRCLSRSPAEAEACLATRILSPPFRRENPAAVAEIQRLARQRPASRRGLLTMLQAAARHDVRHRLHEITAETLVIVGQHDRLLSRASQRTLLSELPRAHGEVIAGAGHDLSVEAPERTAERVLRFLA